MSDIVSIDTLTAEILILKNQTAANIIEIGKRLIIAKEQLPHGEWGKWLEERVDFSDRTARQFMKVAQEFGDSEIGKRLPLSKVYALLSLPAEDREEVIAQPQEVDGKQKTIYEMSVRELQKVIREKKVIEERVEVVEEENQVLRQANKELANRQPRTTEKIVEVEKEIIPPDYESLKMAARAAKELEKQNNILTSKMQALEAEIRSQKPAHDERADRGMKVEFFAAKIRGFLAEVAALGYIGGEFARTSRKAQQEYDAALSSLERWCRDMRDNLMIPEQDKIIDVEVIDNGYAVE